MPIIIEGGSRCAGWWWARHLLNAEKNERVELIEVSGLDSENVPELFREMYALAQGTKCKNHFYQANINPRADEHLSPAQWREAVETLGRNLGFEGQPHFVIQHTKEGRTHRHIVWSRIDQERQRAIPDSLTAQIHERTSRELEIKFDLQRGRSILVPDRDFDRPERRAKKHERFRGAQNGIDPRAIGDALKAIRERSDNGQSFRAGMEAAGYVLARGDRRDFVVIDQAGGDHNLGRRLGMKAAELREFMKGVDAASLPSVGEAKVRQQARQAAQEATRKHGRGGQEGVEAGPQNGGTGQAKAKRPLNPTQDAIRAAWGLSQTPQQLEEALAARGIGLAIVSGAEAAANYRRRAFAKELGRFVAPQREGEIVAVNERGHVYHLNPRTTGAERGEIGKRLAGIDRKALLSVDETREAMRAAGRAAAAEDRRAAREKARPASGIEQAILDVLDATAGDPRKFAAALDQVGLALTRVTDRDVPALDALRRDQDLRAMAADSAGAVREREQRFGRVEPNDLAAVSRQGYVHRLNPQHLESAARRLGEAGMVLPSVTEARARFEIEREAATAFRQEMIDIAGRRRVEKTEVGIARSEAFDARREQRAASARLDHQVDATGKNVWQALGKAGSLFGGAAAAIGKLAEAVTNIFSPPSPLTPDQQERAERVAEEREAADARAAEEARYQKLLDQIARDDAHRREAERLREQDERRRGRDYERDR